MVSFFKRRKETSYVRPHQNGRQRTRGAKQMKNLTKKGKNIANALNVLGEKEITVNIRTTYQQASQGCCDVEIVVCGNVLYSFENMKETECALLGESFESAFNGKISENTYFPHLVEIGGRIRYTNPVINMNDIQQGFAIEEELKTIWQHQDLFSITLPTLKVLQDLHETNMVK